MIEQASGWTGPVARRLAGLFAACVVLLCAAPPAARAAGGAAQSSTTQAANSPASLLATGPVQPEACSITCLAFAVLMVRSD